MIWAVHGQPSESNDVLRSLESACFWNKVHEVEPLFDLLDDGAGDLPIMSMSLITLTADGVSHTHPYATHSLSHFPSPLSLSLCVCPLVCLSSLLSSMRGTKGSDKLTGH